MIPNNNQQTAEANLRLAADITERRGWAVARLVAASVERGRGWGVSDANSVTDGVSEKVSINKATQILRMGDKTISAYLNAWDRAAEHGLATPAADLAPEDGQSADLPDADWSEYYISTNFPGVTRDTHGDQGTPTPEPAPAPLPEPADTHRTVREAIKSDPQVQQIARKALDEVYTEQAQSNRRNNPPREETQRDGDQYDLAALVKARKIKRDIGELVGMVNDLGSGWDEALTGEVDWCINALQAIRSSLSGQSMDDALAALLDGEA